MDSFVIPSDVGRIQENKSRLFGLQSWSVQNWITNFPSIIWDPKWIASSVLEAFCFCLQNPLEAYPIKEWHHTLADLYSCNFVSKCSTYGESAGIIICICMRTWKISWTLAQSMTSGSFLLNAIMEFFGINQPTTGVLVNATFYWWQLCLCFWISRRVQRWPQTPVYDWGEIDWISDTLTNNSNSMVYTLPTQCKYSTFIEVKRDYLKTLC